jgi:protein gp37
MAESTQIEWTDSTWNPVTGCSKITAGCDFCYAKRFSERFRGVAGHPFESGFDLTIRPAGSPSRYTGGNLAASLSIR